MKMIWTMLHTTDDISTDQHLSKFLDEIKSLFPLEEIRVLWHEGTLRNVPLEKMSSKDVFEVYCQGSIALEGVFFETWIAWFRLSGDDARWSLKNSGKRQNMIVIKISTELLSKASFMESYTASLMRLSSLFNITYGECFDPIKKKVNPPTKDNLEDGLTEISWINIYGEEFVNLIGKQKLLTIPAYRSIDIEENLIYVQATEHFTDPDTEIFQKIAAEMKAHIGEEYFRLPRTTKERSGLFGLALDLFQEHLEFSSSKFKAKKTPVFDYSNIYTL